MKLDKSKSFGCITGHQCAAYEQNGNLFDGVGNQIDEEVLKQIATADVESSMTSQGAVLFLRKILSGGPMSETKVYKEVENSGLSWEEVKNVANDIGVKITKQGNGKMWKLTDAS